MLEKEKEHKQLLEKKIFFTQADLPSELKNKKSFFEKIVWSWKRVRKAVLFLFSLQIIVYLLTLKFSLRYLALNILDPLLLVLDFFCVGWILVKLKLVGHRNLWQSEFTILIFGVSLGILTSWFKLLWVRQTWTIPNLIIEPLFMGCLTVLVALIIWPLIKLK